ncbi:hypothetical protein KP79_PYT23345 [Mizuhopecten yessoensis]|uniref:Uncharacterized protein n=1 Tax=Mizuhopecten yessoensis TaxID=6573 RepID=A0A210PPZ3_MIZYE|nr:hypothetical protein KP79_PYT23345 [Mizuhopecten yessoensis]
MNKVLGLIVLACATLYVVVQCHYDYGYSGYPPNNYYGGGAQQQQQQQYGSNRLTNYALARAYYDDRVENKGLFRGGSVVSTAAALLFLWYAFNGTGGVLG